MLVVVMTLDLNNLPPAAQHAAFMPLKVTKLSYLRQMRLQAVHKRWQLYEQMLCRQCMPVKVVPKSVH